MCFVECKLAQREGKLQVNLRSNAMSHNINQNTIQPPGGSGTPKTIQVGDEAQDIGKSFWKDYIIELLIAITVVSTILFFIYMSSQ